MRKILFITGTRADYSKLKPLISAVKAHPLQFDCAVFVTGMHMLSDYGSTHFEIGQVGNWDYRFVNQTEADAPAQVLAKTVTGLADFVAESKPDLLVLHGDRLEALSAAIVGAMGNTRVAHIEGGEVSGTVDDSVRHAITKLAHLHFVSNADAKKRLIRLGEDPGTIFEIGSPELDLMNSSSLPNLAEVKRRYDLPFQSYSISILHPVHSEADESRRQAEIYVKALEVSGRNYVVIESNNDLGSTALRPVLRTLSDKPNFRVLPSMRFEYFLTLLKNSDFIIGNSSTGVREAPHYGIPAVDVGTRQHKRSSSPMILNSEFELNSLLKAISWALGAQRIEDRRFGNGQSAKKFVQLLLKDGVWNAPLQKYFHE